MKLSGSDLTLIRVFDAVVRHGGFAAAQAELNVSQSTISNHITALEQRLGARLCQRGRGGFSLTEKGEVVHRAAKRLFGALDEFSSETSTLKGRLMGELRVGLVDAIATDPTCQLDRAIASFKQRPNEVNVTLLQEAPQALQQKLLSGDLQIGIGSFPNKVSGLSYEPLYEERHSLYCGHGHVFFDMPTRKLTREVLQTAEFVNRGYWREEFQNELGFRNVTATVFQIEPQLMLIRSGKMIGFLPDHYAAPWVEKGVLRRIVGDGMSYKCVFDLILKKGSRPTQVVETFLQDLRNSHREQEITLTMVKA